MKMTQNNQESGTETRRNFALGAGLIGLAAAAGKANAQSTGSMSDLAILNYALTLEHLEAAFYSQGLARLTAADFNTSTTARVLGTGVIAGVYTNLGRIRDHEVTHVSTLRTTIRSLGGTPVEPCTYNFTYRNADEFLQLARTLEETGVQAYDGAVALLAAAALKTAGASIATVEARHAAYLNILVSAVPFPQAFDATKTMREILAAASPFVTSCGTVPFGMNTTAILLPKNLTTVNQQIQLDASQSMSFNGQALRYAYRSVSGSVAITSGDTAKPMVQFSSGPGDYTIEVSVTDSGGGVSTDRITIRYAGR